MTLFIHDYGGYAFTLQLAQQLASLGQCVHYTYSVTTQLVQRLDPAGMNGRFSIQGITLAHPFQKYSFRQRRTAEIEHGQRVAAAILAQRPDVVVSANAPLDAQVLIWEAASKIGALHVYWFQDAIGLATRRLLRGRLPLLGEVVGWYYESLERRLLRQSDRVVLISPDFQPLMARWGIEPNKIRVIPNWAPLEELPIQPKDNPWAQAHGLDQTFVFLYAGILGLKHNPELFMHLARAFAGQAQVVVVSDGGGADWLKKQAHAQGLDNLKVLPFQPKAALPQVLGTADVLVSILKPEAGIFSVPSKVLSYLCAGRPLLLSMPLENQAARLVREARAGLVAAPQDITGWLQSAQKLFNNECLRANMGANARTYAETHFDIQTITHQFESVFGIIQFIRCPAQNMQAIIW